MKRFLTMGFILSSFSFQVLAADASYSILKGEWKGKIQTNLKEEKAGGKPTMGTTGTPVSISFNEEIKGVKGSSSTGTDPKETWEIQGNQYSWNDGTVTVTTEKIRSFEEITPWMRDQMKLSKNDAYFAFRFSNCTVNKTNQPCKAGIDIPDGIEKNGTWIFKSDVKSNTLASNVYYNYSHGGRRILEWQLSKKN